MADCIYLNIWFPSFAEPEILPRALSVLRQFPFSAAHPGIGHVAVHAVAWNEPAVFQETFDFRAQPEHAVALAADFLHDDNAYEFEALWDLWTPAGEGYDSWKLQPRPVNFFAHGARFEDGVFAEDGHIQVDFGLDTPFLYEDLELTALGEERIKANVQKLVGFTSAVEQHCVPSGRVLWSESEENLAQKLIARLQRVQ